MSTERYFGVNIVVVEESDGPRFLRKGAERHTETMSVKEAADKFSKEKIAEILHLALQGIEQ